MISRQEYNQPKKINEFSLLENSTVHRILAFIRNTLPEFENEYKQANLYVHLEDDISVQLCLFFTVKASIENLLFSFNAKKGVDFEIYVSPFLLGSKSIFMLEAKRLSKRHNDYVNGRTGGIERFKREQVGFGTHLEIGGMIGYIQDETREYWHNKINGWIENQMQISTDIIWSKNDRLVSEKQYSDFVSSHMKVSNTTIILYHYWISLV